MPPPAPVAAAPQGPALLPAAVLAQLEDENAAPYFTRRGDEGLLLYAASGRWLTRQVDADGNPKGAAAVDVGPLAGPGSMASLRPVEGGYLAIWSEPVAKNHAIKILALDAEGKAAGAPVLVTQVADDVSWVDILPNAKGALVLWEVTHDDRSDVFVVPAAGGKIDGAPSRVVEGAIGWEAEATERGAAIATVMTDAPPVAGARGKRKPAKTAEEAAPRGARLGKVTLTEIDTRGKASPPVVVSPEASAQVDVTLAEVGGKYLLAWTDERNIDAAVYVATVDPGGKVSVAPHRATAPFGEQALVSLVAESYEPAAPRSKRALLAWEDQLKVQRDGRLIHLATLGPDGQLGRERATLVFSASGPPDIEPDGEGFAALTLAPVHDMPAGVEVHATEAAGKPEAPVWPAFVRFGADLSVVASEPVRAEAFGAGDKVPYITRGLSCRSSKCTTLAIGGSATPREANAPPAQAPLAIVSLPIRETPWKAPAARDADESLPRAESVTALFDGDHLARVAATDLPGGGALAAWVTYVLESRASIGGAKKGKAPPRDEESPGATLGVRAIGANGAPGKLLTIATNALSIGGVALAPSPAPEGKKPETALAWVTSGHGEPQVMLTKLGPDGDKLAQRGLTTVGRKKKGAPSTDASDVAVAYAGGEGSGGDGWIVAWSDTRDGNSEIYAAKVDRSLNKIVPDKRITDAPGDSDEVQIAVRGKDVFLVWSDARQQPDEGNGDIYVARLDAATLKKAGPETRLFASATHSRTPQIQPWGKGFVVTWIEEGGDGKTPGADAEAGLRVAVLDDKGALVGAPELVRAGDGQAVTSAAVGCRHQGCRGVVTATSGDALVLDAFQLDPGSPAGPLKAIAGLTTAGSGQDASPAFAGPAATSLFFADDAVGGGTGRVRWMRIAWP
jgi:hypothetical protein